MATQPTQYIAPRPTSIDGCMSDWSETYLPNTIRSQMDDQYVKVRRRTTGLILTIDTTVTLKAEQYDEFIRWFQYLQAGGTYPTRIKRPQDGKEIVVRITVPPAISWLDKNAFRASMKWEQLPNWSTL
jgi:hypothetical protein